MFVGTEVSIVLFNALCYTHLPYLAFLISTHFLRACSFPVPYYHNIQIPIPLYHMLLLLHTLSPPFSIQFTLLNQNYIFIISHQFYVEPCT